MLVLSRKPGESIHIGGNVTLQVVRISGNRVRLAIDAPRNVRVLRGELDALDASEQNPPTVVSAALEELAVASS